VYCLNIAIFGSGAGTTALHLLTAKKQGDIRTVGVTPKVIITDTPHAGILEVAERMSIPSVLISRKEFGNGTPEFGEAVIRVCKMHDVNFLALLGFLGRIPANVLTQYRKGINLHPAILDPGRLDCGGVGIYGERATLANLIFAKIVNSTRQLTDECLVEATIQAIHDEVDKGVIFRRHGFVPSKNTTLQEATEWIREKERILLLELLAEFVHCGGFAEIFTRDRPVVRRGEEPVIAFACKKAILHFMKKP
jgi:folate-dependent phosphoribosylglycinamide formyltransferase PurN